MAGVGKQEIRRLTLDDLITDAAEYAELDKATAKKAVYAMFWSMIKALNKGESVEIRGFGTLYIHNQKAWKQWSPFIGHYTLPAKKVVKFRPAKAVRYLVEPERFNDHKLT